MQAVPTRGMAMTANQPTRDIHDSQRMNLNWQNCSDFFLFKPQQVQIKVRKKTIKCVMFPSAIANNASMLQLKDKNIGNVKLDTC